MKRFASLVVVSSVAYAGIARADDPCIYPASQATELVSRGLVRAARTKLDACVETCSGDERTRCEDARRTLHVPTAIVRVTAPTGEPRDDVRVVIDGDEAKPNVPIEVDPGTHLVQVQGPRIGESRKVDVAADSTDLEIAFHTAKNAVEIEAEQGGGSGWPWVLVGVGFTGVVTGMIVAAVGEIAKVPDPNGDNPYDLIPNPTLRTVGIATVISGIALVGGGIIWHFLDPTRRSPQRAGFSVTVRPIEGGASLGLMLPLAF